MIELPFLTKPLRGETCNGCGLCCATSLCDAAAIIFARRKNPEVGELKGPCPALEYEGGRAWCGLIRSPEKYLVKDYDVNPDRLPEFVEVLKKGLLVGFGCTMDDPKQNES